MTRLSLETVIPLEYETLPWVGWPGGWLERLRLAYLRQSLARLGLLSKT
ncbi:MAG TPA: hypothetical protein VJ843_04000 [Candidatus Saccharimonadales bacterium]|nr:hypothetical protein [Candidatus Saccharimonadales bacterium]